MGGLKGGELRYKVGKCIKLKISENKEKRIEIRLSESLYNKFISYCKNYNYSYSHLIRSFIIKLTSEGVNNSDNK